MDESARDYLVVRKRGEMSFGEVVHVMGLVDDAGSDARFAMAMYASEQELRGKYPPHAFNISHPGSRYNSNGNPAVIRNASEFRAKG